MCCVWEVGWGPTLTLAPPPCRLAAPSTSQTHLWPPAAAGYNLTARVSPPAGPACPHLTPWPVSTRKLGRGQRGGGGGCGKSLPKLCTPTCQPLNFPPVPHRAPAAVEGERA